MSDKEAVDRVLNIIEKNYAAGVHDTVILTLEMVQKLIEINKRNGLNNLDMLEREIVDLIEKWKVKPL